MSATQEVEIGRILVQGQPTQKVSEISISKIKKAGCGGTHTSQQHGGINKRIAIQATLGKKN
jgi:hypothetical protein